MIILYLLLQRHYGVQEWTDGFDFMNQLAAQMGRLLKGGEPDVNSIAKIMINDWQRVSYSHCLKEIKILDC